MSENDSLREKITRELAALRSENEQLRLVNTQTWCAYCGAKYARTEDSLAQIREHIAVCELHPMRKLEERIKQLESENADLRWVIGENSK